MDSLQKSNALCLKRELVDDCLVKDFKSRRVEVENVSSKVECGSSSDAPAHSCCAQPNLANDCVNYLKSEVPSRVVFYKQGSWCDFPEQIMNSLVDGFKGDKSSVVVVMDDQPLLVDFLSMTLVNLKTRKQRSVAWLDGTDKWFFPSAFFDEEVDESTKLDTSIVVGGAQGLIGGKVVKSPPEVVKQVVIETSPPVLQNPCVVDILRKKIVPVERGSESFLFVQNLFLSGMGSFAMPNNILHIHRYSPKDISAQCRLEAFERQMRLTREKFGDANARYGWLGSRKQDIVGVLINGFVSTGKTTHNADMGAGIYLSPENRAFTSVGLCDVDEKGVQYMLLCRAILGNMGAIKAGSQEEFLSIYDSGVDNCSNPNYYMMWPSHLRTHICLEYLISFRLAPKVQEYLLRLKGLWLCPPPKEVIVDLSTLQPVTCKSGEGPTSPWISFRVLFETIQDSIPSVARELLFYHYEELKENKITREEMVKKMTIIVGEKLLVDSLMKLNYDPSLWYNIPAEVVSYPVSTALDTISIGTRSTNAASATPSHDSPASSVLPEKCEPADSTCGGSPAASAALEGQHFPIPSMCSESSSSRCTDSLDPFAPRRAPLGHDALVRSALLSINVCDSVGPSMESNGHAPLAQSSASIEHDYHVSRPTLGSSESPNTKGLHSVAPSMAPEAQGILAASRAHENSSSPDAKGSDAATSIVAPQFHAPSMVPRFREPRTMAHHLCAPRSMVPHLRVLRKKSKVQAPSTMPEAQYSGAATMVPVIPKPPLPSVAPKGCDSLTSSKECPTPSVVLQGTDYPANLATKRRNAPTLVKKNSARQCGANKKFPSQGVDASSTVTRAADALIALSAHSKKGR